MKRYGIAITLIVGLMTGACNLRSNETYFLNPDGGGKVTLKTTFLHVKIQTGETIDDAAKRIVKSILTQSIGVDTWSNVEYSTGEDNSVNFKGTAYYTDFNKMIINNVTLFFKFKREETKNGYRLVFSSEEKTTTPGDGAKADEVVKKKLSDWQTQKGMFQKPIEISRIERTFKINAKSVEVSNMKLSGDKGKYSVNIVFDGPKIFEAVDAFSSDEKAIRKGYLEGTNKYQNEIFMKSLNGNNKPVSTEVSGPEVVFDYAKEVEAAKKAYPAMYKKLDLEPESESEGVTEETKPETTEVEKPEKVEDKKEDNKKSDKKSSDKKSSDKKKKDSKLDKLKKQLK